MAAAIFNGLDTLGRAKSAGTNVGRKEGQGLHEFVIQCMKEIGYDLSQQKRVQLTPDMVKESDKIIVILDDHSDLPDYVPQDKITFWDIPDAKDKSLEFHRQVRDMIFEKIKGLK